MRIVAKNVDDYLANVPEPARTTLSKLRAAIRSIVPPETTEEIRYGMPTFQYRGGLVGYAAFPKHCGLYPMNGSLVEQFAEELKAYETSKGTIKFPLDKPLPAALLKKIVKTRIAENQARRAQ